MLGTRLDFIYEGQTISIQCDENDVMRDIFARCATKLAKKPEDIYFLSKGIIIDGNSKLSQIKGKDEIIKVLVNNNENCPSASKEEKLEDSKDIICPQCKENCLINLKNYKIDLINCVNGHSLKNIYLDEFKKTQKIDESQIKCNNCNMIKNEVFDKILYICCECHINLCPICREKHDKNHTFIDYELKHYL